MDNGVKNGKTKSLRCPQNHPLIGGNLIWRLGGRDGKTRYRACRQCRNDSAARAMKKLRDKRKGVVDRPRTPSLGTDGALERWIEAATKKRIAELLLAAFV